VDRQDETQRYVVCNADEGEPGTFKDREVMLRRPYLMLEGLAIAARAVGADEVYLYLRGEFEVPWGVVERAIAGATERGIFGDVKFHMHAGQGAYICGEETALLEALEGKRGMPRLKPPFPTEFGLWGKPTLMHNVETIACVPSIVRRGGAWFKALGRTEAGSKLYCVSGHVARPGTYELPLGVTLDELVDAAGGYVGTLKAFSPGGASSGFLPADQRGLALDFKTLGQAGSMLGSAGVVVLNDTIDMKWAALEQLRFFEAESCGQCAPCRIGTRYLSEALQDNLEHGAAGGTTPRALAHVADVAWQMNEGSICGLGQAAPLPLTSALKYFPEDFEA
jgi:NADH:ubiquinone oxidoreductase subunit F (NADH-binding)